MGIVLTTLPSNSSVKRGVGRRGEEEGGRVRGHLVKMHCQMPNMTEMYNTTALVCPFVVKKHGPGRKWEE